MTVPGHSACFPPHRRLPIVLVSAILTLSILSCGESNPSAITGGPSAGGPGSDTDTGQPSPPDPTTGFVLITAVEGNGQHAPVGATLNPLVVEARDADRMPVAGVRINWETISGILSDHSTVTDGGGRTSTVLTLPGRPTDVWIYARAATSNVSGSPIRFIVTATP